jgi:NAD(P)-dependent dehydrogenase (short-subunit alcohol dehydrogenase family)
MPDLKGKVVIVTGAGSGIGYETALAFARAGARVVVSDRREEPLRPLAERVEALGAEALVAPADVSRREEVEGVARAALERFGRIDVLVNNAGYALGATIEQTPERDFREMWETNVLGTLYGMQAVLPAMRRQRSGHIINVSSAAGRIGFPGIGAYSSTKASVISLTEALRTEEREHGIRASVVFPIGTRTRFFESARLIGGTPVGPHGPTQSPEHVAARIVDCARRPTAEVLPYRRLRLGILLHALVPELLTWIGRRTYRRLLRERRIAPAQPPEELQQEEI